MTYHKNRQKKYPFRIPLSIGAGHFSAAQTPQKKTGSGTYWFTKAGGDTYFGNVETVSFKEARSLFSANIRSLSEGQEDSKQKGLTASDLVELLLTWIEKNRSEASYKCRRTHCNRFLNFRVGSQNARIADLPANKMKSADLESWLEHLDQSMGLSAQTRRHAETSIKHCWNWAKVLKRSERRTSKLGELASKACHTSSSKEKSCCPVRSRQMRS